MHYVGHRASETNPLRSIPLFRPASHVLAWTPEQVAAFEAEKRTRDIKHALLCAEAAVRDARARHTRAREDIGDANRGVFGGLKHIDANQAKIRGFRSIAFKRFNQARAYLRQAERQLAAAQAAAAALTH